MRKRGILVVGGVLAIVVVLACIVVLLAGPATGNVFPSIVQDVERGVAPPAQPDAATGGESGASPGSGAFGNASDQAAYQAEVQRMIIWTASAELTVKDTKQAIEDVQSLARELGGYSTGTESWLQNSQLYARITVRVPAEKFDQAMARLRDMAVRVERESASSEDVTEEYVDLESRLRNLEAKEAQLTKFLAEAENTEAVLAVYEQLSATQGEIEQVKGRMSYLEKLSAMATITAELRPEAAARPVIEEGWRPLSTVRNAARSLVDALQGLGNALIWIVIFLLPILLLVALPFLVVFLIVRIIRRRRQSAKSAAA